MQGKLTLVYLIVTFQYDTISSSDQGDNSSYDLNTER